MAPARKSDKKKSLKYKGEYEGAPIDPVMTPEVEKTIAAGSQPTAELLAELAKTDFSRAEELALRLVDHSRPLRLAAIETLAGSNSDRALDALLRIIVEKKIWPEGSSSYIDGAWLQASEALKHWQRADLITELLDRLSLDDMQQMIVDEGYMGNLWREMGITPEAHECRPYAIAMLMDAHFEQTRRDPRALPLLMLICQRHVISDVRKAVVMVILKFGDDTAITQLIESSNYGLELALQELAEKDLTQAEYLAGRLLTAQQYSVKTLAADILGRISSRASIEKLIATLSHPEGYSVINALKATTNPAATEWLLSYLTLDNPNEQCYRYLIIILGGRRDAAALPRLLEIWHTHTNLDMRKTAGSAIIDIGKRDGLEQMAASIEDADAGIRMLAIKAIFGVGSDAAQKRFASYLEPIECAISNRLAVNIIEALADLLENPQAGFDYKHDLRWINIVIKLLKNGEVLKQAERFPSLHNWRHKEQSLLEAVIKTARHFKGQPRVAGALVQMLPIMELSEQRKLIMYALLEINEPSILKQFLAWSGAHQPTDDAEAKKIQEVIKRYS